MTDFEKEAARNSVEQVVAEYTEQLTQYKVEAAVVDALEILQSGIVTDHQFPINLVYTAHLGAPDYAVDPVRSEPGPSKLLFLIKSRPEIHKASRKALTRVAVMSSVDLPPSGARPATPRTNPLVPLNRGPAGRVLTHISTEDKPRNPPRCLPYLHMHQPQQVKVEIQGTGATF